MSTEQPSPTSRQAGQQKSTLFNRDRHLRKTKLCVFFQQGVCHRQSTCQFAHGKSELQEAPVLYKTRICPKLDGCSNKNCTYAHNQEELHFSDVSFKTATCHWHLKGMCSSGKTCRFAHDMRELRGIHGEQQGKASKVASMAGKVKNKANDKLLRQGSNLSDSAPRCTKSKLGVACYTAANRMADAHKVEEENLAPTAEEMKNLLSQSKLIQLGANKDYTSAWDLPVKVYSKLSTEIGFLDSLYLPPSLQLSNDSMDFNIIPENPPCERVDGFHQEKPDISSLVTKVRDLSEEVKTLQLRVAQQHRTRQGSSDNIKSTKSGSLFNYSADDSSSACTPRTSLQKLSQLKAFSRELQSASDLNLSMLSDHGFSVRQYY